MMSVHLRRADGDADEALADLVRAVTGAQAAHIVRSCPGCGSSTHGRPLARTEFGDVHVSLSRPTRRGAAVVCVCLDAPVGVDVEAVGHGDFDGFDEVASHPLEHIARADRTRLWVRKEAILKAHGTGLAVDPRTVRLADDGSVLEGPEATVVDVDLPGWVCSVAVLGLHHVDVVWH